MLDLYSRHCCRRNQSQGDPSTTLAAWTMARQAYTGMLAESGINEVDAQAAANAAANNVVNVNIPKGTAQSRAIEEGRRRAAAQAIATHSCPTTSTCSRACHSYATSSGRCGDALYAPLLLS